MIAPQMVGDVTWARTSLNTSKGKVSCYWTRDPSKGTWTIDVTIPEGSDAEIHLPDGRRLNFKEGNHRFSSSN